MIRDIKQRNDDLATARHAAEHWKEEMLRRVRQIEPLQQVIEGVVETQGTQGEHVKLIRDQALQIHKILKHN